MQITASTRNPLDTEPELLAIPLTELDPARWRLPARVAALDKQLGGALSAALAQGDFRGKRRETLLLYPHEGSAKRVLLIGLGAESDLDGRALREAAGQAIHAARRARASSPSLVAPSGRRMRAPALCQALAEGAVLGVYRFDRYQNPSNEDGNGAVERLQIHLEKSGDLRSARAGIQRGVTLADSQNLARDLSNEPPNVMTPAKLAQTAEKMAKRVGLKARILEPNELKKHKLGALLAVAQGSHNKPRLIVLEHNAPKATRGKKKPTRHRPTVCLVGKGVCFDSGGLSLKPAASMVKMKHDMSGGAAVIGAMRAVALLKIPLHVVGIVGAVENMPSGHAYRVDDILTSASGKTIEVTNTDAEGRLVLADCLHYAQNQFEPEAIIDLATLTGAASIALGPWAAAVVGNHDRLAEAIVAAGETSGERFWQLPLWDAHRDHMKSKIADVRQTGGRDAGTITAAAFLSHFVADDKPWAHLDIAAVADTALTSPTQARGATGFGVRALLELLGGWKGLKLN
ncbi:MAG: leucyl aminopeptidase [Deltaproteobacteria bacterium]|nr:leucyl aminopeptidase [Deltaproteobacteria bacterium]MBW2395084.1 leucyl aminopeptidase [Deltaproteobacteria bacterium]